MLQITTTLATPEQVAEIQNLTQQLSQADVHPAVSIYGLLNVESGRNHRIEVPFDEASALVNILQTAKNVHYDNSYSKRGIFSIFFNMERKWERLIGQLFGNDPVVGKASEGIPLDAANETFLDTCVDLAAYSMKLVAWICARRPDLYIKLLKYIVAESVQTGILKTGHGVIKTRPFAFDHNEASFFHNEDATDTLLPETNIGKQS